MSRFWSLLSVAVLATLCLTGSLFAAAPPIPGAPPPVPVPPVAQPLQPLTLQSVPQMLISAGFQVHTKVDNIGTYWIVINLQNGKSVVIDPQNVVGNNVGKLLLGSRVPGAPAFLNQTQQQMIQPLLVPGYFTNPVGTELRVLIYHNFNNSNPQELKTMIEKLISKADQLGLALANNGGFQPPPVNPVPVPPAVPFLAGTTWTGTETSPNPGSKLTIVFLANNQVMTTDFLGPHYGTYTVNGNVVTVTLGAYATYTATLNGLNMSGTAAVNTPNAVPWSFFVNRQ